ncbi:MAG: PTS sugar transporter subunit IIA [Lentisphaerae bacterium]|jgi:mannitol/fructose-specific phosphotransferase system IIA component (Ntr-type)|nr:PTS sugar transporter subunit IIA [Lentisphaerota bacterium]
MINISELLLPSLIKVNLEAETKDELFPELVELFVAAGCIQNRAEALQVLEEREAKMTTGISNGIAIPHGKLPEAKQILLALGISREGIEYNSIDGEPVHIVIAIFAQVDNPGEHIEVLAEISRLFAVPGFREKLSSARTPEEVLRLIEKEE